uniref:Ubiquitin-activating enzyme n=1 Tax=Gracilariopsis lemaneiformis TaxID=2782 RepID=V5NFI0_GRALE|nr:ubiquitin-activating enzyme [Gracilariopsis lemaneiformis]AHA87177.1 ubiquitin-activating enzyme [Gracilariopsis lemaneiformis]
MPAQEDRPDGQPPVTAPRELTGEEAALYDRQIRLWGLEAQRKLASSSVLLAGDVCSLTAQELAKNVLLAGVMRLGLVEYDDKYKKAPRSFLGDSVPAIVQSLKEMNPLVNVQVIEKPCLEVVKQFSVVCAIGMSRKEELLMTEACRAAEVPFLAGRVAGVIGWVFLDLGDEYSYQKSESNASGPHDSASVSMKTASYCSYKAALDANWGRETARSAFGWHVAYTLQEFASRHSRLPSADETDVKLMTELYAELSESKKSKRTNTKLIERVANTASAILGPVCAIVGGMWGREVIKIVSGKGEPLNNLFFFNAETSAGSVERVGPPG